MASLRSGSKTSAWAWHRSRVTVHWPRYLTKPNHTPIGLGRVSFPQVVTGGHLTFGTDTEKEQTVGNSPTVYRCILKVTDACLFLQRK